MAITRAVRVNGGAWQTSQINQDADAIWAAQDPPGCIVRRVASQSIGTSAFTNVTFDTEIVDNAGMFAVSSTDITVQHDGYYHIQWGVKWTSNGAGVRAHFVSMNGTEIDDASFEIPAFTGNPRHCGGGYAVAVAGDVVRLNVFQSSGGALNLLDAKLAVVRAFGPGS